VNKRFGILLAQSPFQMLTTAAAAEADGIVIDSAFYLTVTSDLNQAIQLNSFLPVHFVCLPSTRFLVFILITNAIKIRLKHPFAQFNVYHGAFYVSTWMHLITFLVQADTLTFCDDGVSTLLASKQYFSLAEAQKYFYPSKKPLSRFRHFIYSKLVTHNFQKKLWFRSIFASLISLSSHNIRILPNSLQNSLAHTHNIINLNSSKKALFISSSLFSSGYIDRLSTTKILSAFICESTKRGIVPSYYPHRRELEAEVYIARNLGFEILEPITPIEFFLIHSQILPGLISSPGSTALFSLSHIFDEQVNLTSFDIPKSFFLSAAAREWYECVEDACLHYGIPLIPIL